MKTLRYLLLILCLSFGMNSLAGYDLQAASGQGGSDPNIIIFSQSHGAVSNETGNSGVLKLGVTCFSPIWEILINGTSVSSAGDSVASIEYTYQLEPGENRFVVTVVTADGRREKSFIINRVEPSKKGAFQMVGIAGLSYLDNVASAKEDKQSGTKLSLVVVPQYILPLGDAALRFRGVMLRERFSERDFSGNEISYTQIRAEWMKENTGLGDISGGLAYNDIRTNNDNPMLGEDESMSEVALMASLKQPFAKDMSWRVKGELTLRDSKEEVTSANDEADAREVELEGGMDFKTAGILGDVKAVYGINDAKGDYVDYSTMKLGVKVKYPLGQFIPGLSVSYKEKTGKNENAFGVQQKDKVTTAQVKVDYKWTVLPNSQLSLKLQSKNQTSNVSTSEYSASEVTLALTYVF